MDQIEKTIYCPYCGEPLQVLVDPSEPHQDYIEDCQVCCRPIRFIVEVDAEGDAWIEPRHEDDA